MDKFLESVRRRWGTLTVYAVWIGGVIMGVLVGPPTGSYDPFAEHLTHLVTFLVTILVGLFVVIAWKRQEEKHLKLWFATTVVSLAIGVAAYLTYVRLSELYTADYNGGRVVVGPDSALTTYAKGYLETHPDITKETLIMDFAGQVNEIWTEESIGDRRFMLAVFYILLVPLFTVMMMAIIQCLRCVFPDDNDTTNSNRAPEPLEPRSELIPESSGEFSQTAR